MVSERHPVLFMERREQNRSSRVNDLFSSFHGDKDEGIIPGARSPESMQVACSWPESDAGTEVSTPRPPA
jgi:hypothetical protein